MIINVHACSPCAALSHEREHRWTSRAKRWAAAARPGTAASTAPRHWRQFNASGAKRTAAGIVTNLTPYLATLNLKLPTEDVRQPSLFIPEIDSRPAIHSLPKEVFKPPDNRIHDPSQPAMASSLRPAMRAARAVARVRPSLPITASRLFSSSSPSSAQPPQQPGRDLEVGELQGAEFKIEPLRRVGEDPATMRARLLCAFSETPFT